jgi:hypothetical protein
MLPIVEKKQVPAFTPPHISFFPLAAAKVRKKLEKNSH